VKVTVTRDSSTPPSSIEQTTIPDLEVIEPAPIPLKPLNEPNIFQLAEEKPALSLWTRVKAWLLSPWFWLVPAAGIFAGTILLILLQNYKKANVWASAIQSRLKKNTRKIPDRLIVRIGERTQHLGRLDQIRKIHIGSGPDNTIRIYDPSVPKQQLRLFRKGSDLYLKNLSTKPAWINGLVLNSGKTERLPLPSILKLSESVTIRIELQKIPVTQIQSKEAPDGRA
jgi:hypothetical protein